MFPAEKTERMNKNLFIAGKPGCGKTTLIKEVCLPAGGRVGGFYTEEMKSGPERRGFLLKTFDGKEGVLAMKGMKSPVKLNKYGIDLNVLEEIGVVSLLAALRDKEIIVIDEIGSMEIVSDIFRKTLFVCLSSNKKVLATIRYNSQPFTDEVKRMGDTSLLCLSRENAGAVKNEVRAWMGGS